MNAGGSLPRRATLLRGVALGGLVTLLSLTPATVWAQEAMQESPPDAAALPEQTQSMTDDEARKALATPVPADATPRQRIDLLLRQRAAARIVGDQAALIRVLEQLTEVGKGEPDWARYMLDLINAEFTFGSPKRSIEYGEKLLGAPDLDPVLRASVAASLTWKYCDAHDARNCERVFAQAERAYAALPAGITAGVRAAATTSHLQAKAIVLRVRGDLDGQVETLREATVTARNYLQRSLATAGGDTQAAQYRGAVAMADYTAGQLIYALLRQGRAAEALAIAQDGLARARLAGLGPDSLGGWHHRMAAALITQRRFDEAFVNARASATELRRAGGRASGQQYALARNAEIVALIGLERWAEADATYIAFMDEIRGDKVSYDRSYDSRLAALLAAKNNRPDVALPLIDSNYRFRLRLYGPKHPFTVETRGVRGAIQLINNAPGAAMMDYDDFFAVLLDSGSSWVDLAPVGPRGAIPQHRADRVPAVCGAPVPGRRTGSGRAQGVRASRADHRSPGHGGDAALHPRELGQAPDRRPGIGRSPRAGAGAARPVARRVRPDPVDAAGHGCEGHARRPAAHAPRSAETSARRGRVRAEEAGGDPARAEHPLSRVRGARQSGESRPRRDPEGARRRRGLRRHLPDARRHVRLGRQRERQAGAPRLALDGSRHRATRRRDARDAGRRRAPAEPAAARSRCRARALQRTAAPPARPRSPAPRC